VRTFSQVKGAIGTVCSLGAESMHVTAQGGQIEVLKVRYDDGKKISAAQFCSETGVGIGTQLGE